MQLFFRLPRRLLKVLEGNLGNLDCLGRRLPLYDRIDRLLPRSLLGLGVLRIHLVMG